MGVSREDIRAGYRLILDREPESEVAYEAHQHLEDVSDLRLALMNSVEGRARLRADLVQSNSEELEVRNFARPALFHIHIEKTGGTALLTELMAHFEESRIAPAHLHNLFGMPLLELSRFDLISSHSDYMTSTLVPRMVIRRICMFREPYARLISFYRFHRAHPTAWASGNHYIRLAQELDPVAFFQDSQIVSTPRINNSYARIFGTHVYGDLSHCDWEICDAVLERAAQRIRSLDAIGLTERSAESLDIMLRDLGMSKRAPMPIIHDTDSMALLQPEFSAVPPVPLTEDLQRAMEPLVRYDQRLYAVAEAEFARRMQPPAPPRRSIWRKISDAVRAPREQDHSAGSA